MTGLNRRAFLAGAVAAPTEDEWVDVAGGAFPSACWEREGGALHALAPRAAFHDLRSTGEYGDFEFRWEFRLAPGANSGVKYLLYKIDEWTRPGTPGTQARARGFEFQLIDDEAEDAQRDPAHVTGALYGIQAPSRRSPNVADGRFHAAAIRRQRALVEHFIDGDLVLKASLDSPEIAARCAQRKMPRYSEMAGRKTPLSLQHHNSEAWFRALNIRSL